MIRRDLCCECGKSDIEARVRGILHAYRDDMTREAVDQCERCGPLAMCDFHSLLSLLAGDTHVAPHTTTADPKADPQTNPIR